MSYTPDYANDPNVRFGDQVTRGGVTTEPRFYFRDVKKAHDWIDAMSRDPIPSFDEIRDELGLTYDEDFVMVDFVVRPKSDTNN